MKERKPGTPVRKSDLSFETRIESLKQEIELLESLIPLRDYFHPISHARNSYIVEIRKIVAQELLNKGLSYSEIGRIFGQDHASVMNVVKIENHSYIQKEVQANYREWMANKDYPATYQVRVPNEFSSIGEARIVHYKLVKQILKHS